MCLNSERWQPTTFDELYQAHSAKARRVILQTLRNSRTVRDPQTDADDIAQHFWMDMWKLHSEGKELPESFLMTAAKNDAIDHRRKEQRFASKGCVVDIEPLKREPRERHDSDSDEPLVGRTNSAIEKQQRDTWEKKEREERKEALSDALDELPNDQWQALILAHYSEMSSDDIASELGITAATARKRIERARAYVKKYLSSLVTISLFCSL